MDDTLYLEELKKVEGGGVQNDDTCIVSGLKKRDMECKGIGAIIFYSKERMGDFLSSTIQGLHFISKNGGGVLNT